MKPRARRCRARADARGQVRVDRIDAHMDAVHQRDRAAPRARNRERVAGKLVGAADGHDEDLAQRDVEPDQRRPTR